VFWKFMSTWFFAESPIRRSLSEKKKQEGVVRAMAGLQKSPALGWRMGKEVFRPASSSALSMASASNSESFPPGLANIANVPGVAPFLPVIREGVIAKYCKQVQEMRG
jgi:hypothetical protein